MWSKPWSYKEGLVIGAGLLVIGALLQMSVGTINWSLFACPVNVIVLVVYLIALIAMHLLRKRIYLFGWLSHYSAAVSSLVWVVGMTVIMGLIRQAPSGHASNDMLGFSQMISSWPFVLLYFWMVTALGLTILRAGFPFRIGRLSFLLNHIGLFIAFIGLQNANIVVGGSTLLQLFSIDGYNSAKGVEASMSNVGITVILALIGVGITGILVIKNVKGNILWGILITWILGIICQMAGIYVANPEIGFYSLLPDFSKGFTIPSIMPVFGKLDFSGIFSLNFIVVIFAFLFVDMFDTIGTLIGVSTKAGMLDEEGRLPNIKGALMADAVATTVGAVLGTTTTTTFVESASGVSEGGRTGLTSATTAILFGLSLFLSPIFLAIPSFATAPALIVVGFYMLTNVTHIDFDDFSEALPCYICILAMPFFYSISEGISMGVISYVILNLMTGKAKEKKISALMYVLTVLFILKYVFL